MKAGLHPPYCWALNWDVVKTLPTLHLFSVKAGNIFPQRPGHMTQRAELKGKTKADFFFSLRGESRLVVEFVEECNTFGVMTVVLYSR